VAAPRERIHFVTGRLAEPSLRAMLEALAPKVGFDYSVDVLGVSVAALLTTKLVARRMRVPEGATRVVLPGLVSGPLEEVEAVVNLPVERGPDDLRQLDEFFGETRGGRGDYGCHDIEILAEINHAPRLTREAILAEATRMAADGADIIDIGCDPEGGCPLPAGRGIAGVDRLLRSDRGGGGNPCRRGARPLGELLERRCGP
jgi:hypothetical protein